jgi:hypothetical protein
MDVRPPVGKVRIDGKSPATFLGNLALINEADGQDEIVTNAMREIESGFDVVIGNPPYGVKFPSGLKHQLSALYPEAAKVPDSYAFFVIKGKTLLRSAGTLAYIIPNTFCDLENAAEFRCYLLTNTKIQRIWQSGWVFNAAVVDTLVLLLEATTPSIDHEILVITDESKNRKKQANFLNTPLAKIDFRSTDAVLQLKERLQHNTKPLSADFYVKAGVKMYELGKGTPPQSEEIVTTKPYSHNGKCPAAWKVLYRGGDIAPFRLTDSGERIQYGPWLAAPRSPDLFDPPKILMRRTDDHLRSSLDMSDAICVNSCHVIKILAPSKDALAKYFATLAVLNSRVCQWAFEAENPQMVGKVFAEIKVVYVERLPLPAFQAKHLTAIQPLVQIQLFLNEIPQDSHGHPPRDPLMLAYWERILNGLVYELYFPEELHATGLHLFDLVASAQLPDLAAILEKDRLGVLRKKFEEIYDIEHPLRIALDKLQTLDTVRIIEGKEPLAAKPTPAPAPIVENWRAASLKRPLHTRHPLGNRYQPALVAELLAQAGLPMSFEVFRRAYWFLTQPDKLAAWSAQAQPAFGVRQWRVGFTESLPAQSFFDHLKAMAQQGQIKLRELDGEICFVETKVEAVGIAHVVCDARLAILAAEAQLDMALPLSASERKILTNLLTSS